MVAVCTGSVSCWLTVVEALAALPANDTLISLTKGIRSESPTPLAVTLVKSTHLIAKCEMIIKLSRE